MSNNATSRNLLSSVRRNTMNISVKILNKRVTLTIRDTQPTLEDIHAFAVQHGRCNRNGITTLVDQVWAYRKMANNGCSIVEARDYVWKLHGRPIRS